VAADYVGDFDWVAGAGVGYGVEVFDVAETITAYKCQIISYFAFGKRLRT
jgi:hypothetical protein